MPSSVRSRSYNWLLLRSALCHQSTNLCSASFKLSLAPYALVTCKDKCKRSCVILSLRQSSKTNISNSRPSFNSSKDFDHGNGPVKHRLHCRHNFHRRAWDIAPQLTTRPCAYSQQPTELSSLCPVRAFACEIGCTSRVRMQLCMLAEPGRQLAMSLPHWQNRVEEARRQNKYS